MRALLDVNVLIALLDRLHVEHAKAHQWFAQNRADGWASCPLTENGCLRILTNPRYPAQIAAAEVLLKLDAAKRGGNYEFWPDDLSVTDAEIFVRAEFQGHKQVTDVYLLALSVKHDGRLVTFDRGIRLAAIRGAKAENLLVL